MSEASELNTRVADNPEQSRYEIFVDGELAGFTTYRLRPNNRIVALHSEVFPAFAHHGLASELARRMLDEIRARGLLISPRCPFVAQYIRDHDDYHDLVSDIA